MTEIDFSTERGFDGAGEDGGEQAVSRQTSCEAISSFQIRHTHYMLPLLTANNEVITNANMSLHTPTMPKRVAAVSKPQPIPLSKPHRLLGYSTSPIRLYSSFNVLGTVNRLSKSTLPALSHVPLLLAPPKVCCPITAAVILQLM